MDIPEEFVLVTIFDPGLPSFVSGEVEYLGSKAVAGRVESVSRKGSSSKERENKYTVIGSTAMRTAGVSLISSEQA